MVTKFSSSIFTSFVRKSAPIVALYCFENLRFTYWFIREVLPTPESPNIMSFRSVLCVLIISHKEEEKVFSHRKRCASRRVERERERDVTLERSSAFAFRTTPSKSSPRGNRKRIEIFHSLSLSLLEEEDQKRKNREKTRECVCRRLSFERARYLSSAHLVRRW